MNLLTGSAVCVLLLLLGIMMIIKAQKHIKTKE
jgi:Ca2+/Na+ antiporter